MLKKHSFPHSLSQFIRNDLIYISALILICLKYLWGHLTWYDAALSDEVFYIHLMRQGFLDIHSDWGPLYSLWYYFLSLFEPHTLRLIFLNHNILLVLCALTLFYWAKRASGNSSFFAFIISFFWAITSSRIGLESMSVALVWIVWGVLLSRLSQNMAFSSFSFLILSVSFFCIYIRPEISIVFFVSCVVWIFCLFFMSGERGSDLALCKKIVLMILMAYIVLWIGSPFERGRNQVAFCQHFAYSYVMRHPDISLNPWLQWPIIFKQATSGSSSIMELLERQPKLFFEHIFYNVKIFMKHTINFFVLDFHAYLEPVLNFIIRWTSRLLVGVLLVLSFIRFRSIENIKRAKKALLTLFIVAVPGILSSLLLYPRDHYRFIFIGFMWVLLTCVLWPIANFFAERIRSKYYFKFMPHLFSLALVILAPNLNAGFCIWPDFNQDRGVESRVPRNLLALRMLELQPKKTANILAQDWAVVYYFPIKSQQWVPSEYDTHDFLELLKAKDIDWVVTSPLFKRLSKFPDQDSYRNFVKNPENHGFVRHPVDRTDYVIYIRSDNS